MFPDPSLLLLLLHPRPLQSPLRRFDPRRDDLPPCSPAVSLLGSAMGLSALPSFSRRHRVPTEHRNEGGKPGAFAPQRRESLAFPSPPLLVLALQEHSASF